MKSFYLTLTIVFITLVCGASNVSAETRYVSDQLVVSLREQPQNNAPSLTYLRTDMPVEIIEESGDFLKVSTTAGEIGYIKGKYLTTKRPKAEVIKQLQLERDRLATKVETMKKQVSSTSAQGAKSQQDAKNQLEEFRSRARDLEVELKRSQTALEQAQAKYRKLQEDAGNVIKITQERDSLRQSNQELQASVEKLDQEAQSLAMSGAIKWFLAGAGVLFFGWIIGKSSGKRRRSMF